MWRLRPGDPFLLALSWARSAGLLLCAVFAIWNGWALWMMATHRTALLSGGATRVVLDRGPFGLSRNQLYVFDIALVLLRPSTWALLLVPVGTVAVFWGAILPEERNLAAKFSAEYDAHRRRVRRWL